MATAIPWDLIVLLLALAVIVPWRGMARVRSLLRRPDFASGGRIAVYTSTIAAQWFVVGLTAWRCWARGWSAARLGIALPDPAMTISLGLALALLFGLTQLAGFRGLSRVPVEQRGRIYEVASKLMPRNALEASVFVALVATVSLCEEFLYRGFVFAALQQIFHNSAGALIGSSVLFSVGHLYQGRRGVLLTFFLGMIFGGVRCYTGSLVPGIIAHFVVDLLAGFAAPGALWDTGRQRATSTNN